MSMNGEAFDESKSENSSRWLFVTNDISRTCTHSTIDCVAAKRYKFEISILSFTKPNSISYENGNSLEMMKNHREWHWPNHSLRFVSFPIGFIPKWCKLSWAKHSSTRKIQMNSAEKLDNLKQNFVCGDYGSKLLFVVKSVDSCHGVSVHCYEKLTLASITV